MYVNKQIRKRITISDLRKLILFKLAIRRLSRKHVFQVYYESMQAILSTNYI